jgi:membrane protease YdiL (CAAX protease family)
VTLVSGRALAAGPDSGGHADLAARGGVTALPPRVSSLSPRLLLGLALVWVLFDRVAGALGSDRGQAGLVIGGLVITATLAVEMLLFRKPIGAAARALGLGRPTVRGVIAATALGLLLLLVFPVFGALTVTRLALTARWGWLVPGLFAQAGVAEEVLLRGYLFRHLRDGRSFWRAAWAAAGPFAAVHLVLLLTVPWPVALAAIGVAVVLSFPLAYLFELGDRTIWAPAVLHFVAQGAIKVVAPPAGAGVVFPITWMAACAVVPFLAWAWRRPTEPLG